MGKSQWFSARLQHLHCWRTGDTYIKSSKTPLPHHDKTQTVFLFLRMLCTRSSLHNILHVRRNITWMSVKIIHLQINSSLWKTRVAIWALGYISKRRTRDKNTAPDFWFNNRGYSWLFLLVSYLYFILAQDFMQITDNISIFTLECVIFNMKHIVSVPHKQSEALGMI